MPNLYPCSTPQGPLYGVLFQLVCVFEKNSISPTKRARSATRCNARCMANAGLPRLVFKSAEDGCYVFPLAGLRQGISLRLSLIVDYIRRKLHRRAMCGACAARGCCVCVDICLRFSFLYSIQWKFSPFPFFCGYGSLFGTS